MLLVSGTREHASEDLLACIERQGPPARPIGDGVALAIAAAFQSPGTMGRVFATLASTGRVDADALHAEIDAHEHAYGVTKEGSESTGATLGVTMAITHGRLLAALRAWAFHKEHPTRTCEYFLLCTRPAIVGISHPILGAVPTCEECAGKVQRIGGSPDAEVPLYTTRPTPVR